MNLAFLDFLTNAMPAILCMAAAFCISSPSRGILVSVAGAAALCLSFLGKHLFRRLHPAIGLWGLLLAAECTLVLSMGLTAVAVLVFAALLTVSYATISGLAEDSSVQRTITASYGITGVALVLWGICLLMFTRYHNMAGLIPAIGAAVCAITTIIINHYHKRWNMQFLQPGKVPGSSKRGKPRPNRWSTSSDVP